MNNQSRDIFDYSGENAFEIDVGGPQTARAFIDEAFSGVFVQVGYDPGGGGAAELDPGDVRRLVTILLILVERFEAHEREEFQCDDSSTE